MLYIITVFKQHMFETTCTRAHGNLIIYILYTYTCIFHFLMSLCIFYTCVNLYLYYVYIKSRYYWVVSWEYTKQRSSISIYKYQGKCEILLLIMHILRVTLYIDLGNGSYEFNYISN